MIENFEKYLQTILHATFSFYPIIEVTELPGKVISCTLDGTPKERAEMMGKEAHTFQAIKMLLRVFARKQDRKSTRLNSSH